MKENHLEDACLEWLAGLGWTCVEGDAVSPSSEPEARSRYSDVVLEPRLRAAVERLNPGLSPGEVDEAVGKLASYGGQSVVDANKEAYDWLRNGVPVERIEADGRRTVLRVRTIDIGGPNDLLAVRQLTIHGQKIRRPDIVLFVNGVPLVVIELKNPADLNADIGSAWNQIQTYKADIPQLFYYNLLSVISDGTVARYGSLTADLGRHSRWRLLDGKKVGKGQLELEVLIRGLLAPATLRGLRGRPWGRHHQDHCPVAPVPRCAQGCGTRIRRPSAPTGRQGRRHLVHPRIGQVPLGAVLCDGVAG
jgi:type I restriction enzyme R subunit